MMILILFKFSISMWIEYMMWVFSYMKMVMTNANFLYDVEFGSNSIFEQKSYHGVQAIWCSCNGEFYALFYRLSCMLRVILMKIMKFLCQCQGKIAIDTVVDIEIVLLILTLSWNLMILDFWYSTEQGSVGFAKLMILSALFCNLTILRTCWLRYWPHIWDP